MDVHLLMDKRIWKGKVRFQGWVQGERFFEPVLEPLNAGSMFQVDVKKSQSLLLMSQVF